MGRLILLILIISISFQAYSQEAEKLKVLYESFQNEHPKQNLELVLNQPKYAPGDTIFFKAYLLNDQFEFERRAEIVWVYLVDDQGSIIQQQIIKVENGSIANQLILDNKLDQGYYNLTAHTNSMKNRGKDFFFQKTIPIIKEKQIAPAVIDPTNEPIITIETESKGNIKILAPGFNPNTNTSLLISNQSKIIYHSDLNSEQLNSGLMINKSLLGDGLHEVVIVADQQLMGLTFFEINNLKTDVDTDINITPKTISNQTEVAVTVQFEELGISDYSVSVINSDVFQLSELETSQKRQLKRARIKSEWSQILDTASIRKNYRPQGLLRLSGLAMDRTTGEPVPANSNLMFYLQEDFMRYELLARPRGRFDLDLLDIYGEDELLVTAVTPQGDEIKDIVIEWIKEPLPAVNPAPRSQVLEESDLYAEFNNKLTKINEAYEFFSNEQDIDSLAELQMNEVPETPILDIDNSVNVEDYYLFPTMAQFVKEVVRPLRIGRTGGNDIVRMKYLEPDIATGDPIYFIDGIATPSTNYFLSLDPKDLKTISVIKLPRKLSRFGNMARNGIVIVESKFGTLRQDVNENMLIKGLSQEISFNEVDGDNRSDSQKPDFRSTIYWNPSLPIDTEGNSSFRFSTSDDQSSLLIMIQGIYKGKPFLITKEIPFEGNN